MPDAYIYDAVRTPRGRGKPDGSLHEVSTLGLASHRADARSRRATSSTGLKSTTSSSAASIRSARPAATSRGPARSRPGFRRQRAGRADQPLLRLRPRRGEFRRRAGHVGPARSRDRRRRREHEPRRHRRLGRRLAGRSRDRHSLLFHAAGRLGRSHRDEIRFFARRRGRLCGGVAKARRARLGGRAASSDPSCR